MEEAVRIRYIGRMEYSEAWELQRTIFDRLVEAKAEGAEAQQEILLVEHPHVYTLGRSGNGNNLLVDEKFLESIGATYFHTDRGGDITYHGYGQLVGYPILDLEKEGLSLKGYIDVLEQSIIDTVAEYGIKAGRVPGAAGVWITQEGRAPRKICAVGVRASRYVTMHGFALNVTTDMGYFAHINPCGFSDRGATSIEMETGLRPALEDVAGRFAANFTRRAGMTASVDF